MRHFLLLAGLFFMAACSHSVAPVSLATASKPLSAIDTVSYRYLTVQAHGVLFSQITTGENQLQGRGPFTDSSVRVVDISDSLFITGTRGDSLTFGFSNYTPSMGNIGPSGYHHSATLLRDGTTFLNINGGGGSFSSGGTGQFASSSSSDSSWGLANIPFTVMPDRSLHGYIDLSTISLNQISGIVLFKSSSSSSTEGHYSSSGHFATQQVQGIEPGAFVEVWVRP